MLLLIYALVLGFVLVIGSIFPIALFVVEFVKKDFSHWFKFLVGLIGFGLSITFFVIIQMFISYHFNLVDKNMTTIDHLDEKRGNIKDYNYDFGKDFNWKSIFGQSRACWFFPVETGPGAPHGDGTVFMKNMLSEKKVNLMSDQEEENDGYYDIDKESEAEDWAKEKDFEDPLN